MIPMTPMRVKEGYFPRAYFTASYFAPGYFLPVPQPYQPASKPGPKRKGLR